nr:hypothetical protein Hi04_10k_c5016_00028 [uncultured bacterium]
MVDENRLTNDIQPEVIALLTEIRDLQKAHFAKYCEFTAAVIEQQKSAAERQKNAQSQSREETQRFREQISEQQLKTQTTFATSRVVAVIAAVLQTALIAFLVFMILSRQP